MPLAIARQQPKKSPAEDAERLRTELDQTIRQYVQDEIALTAMERRAREREVRERRWERTRAVRAVLERVEDGTLPPAAFALVAQAVRRQRGAVTGGHHRGHGPDKIRQAYTQARARTPHATHKAICAAVARQLEVTESRVRHIVTSPTRQGG